MKLNIKIQSQRYICWHCTKMWVYFKWDNHLHAHHLIFARFKTSIPNAYSIVIEAHILFSHEESLKYKFFFASSIKNSWEAETHKTFEKVIVKRDKYFFNENNFLFLQLSFLPFLFSIISEMKSEDLSYKILWKLTISCMWR